MNATFWFNSFLEMILIKTKFGQPLPIQGTSRFNVGHDKYLLVGARMSCLINAWVKLAY